MYNFEWHALHADKTAYSASSILSMLKDIFGPRSILDVGCGDGIWLAASETTGFTERKGVDGPWTDMEKLKIPQDEFYICDLEEKFDLRDFFDLAISLEVAEHVQNSSSDLFVDNLVHHSDLILFSAAIPYQGGFRHINEQWQSYWAEKFAERGFVCLDLIRPCIWDDTNVWFWYRQNTLVYVRSSRKDLLDRAELYAKTRNLSSFPVDMVHPEKYLAIAAYDEIAFKPLIKKLPSRLMHKIRSVARGRV